MRNRVSKIIDFASFERSPVHRRILREAITTLRNSENSIWMDRHLVKILEIAPNYIVSEFRCQLNQDEWRSSSVERIFGEGYLKQTLC